MFGISNRKLALAACLAATTAMTAPTMSAAQDVPQAALDALAFFSADPTWMGPESSPPIAEDRFVIAIPCMQAAIGCGRPSDGFLEAAEAVGWRTQMIDPAGDPARVQAAVRTAIELGADGIFMAGGNVTIMGDTLQAALDAGIYMITMAGVGNTPGEGSWHANIYENTEDYARAWAAYIAVNSPGARILYVNDSEFAEIDAQHPAFMEAIAEYCPTCEVAEYIDFSIVNIATTMPQQVKAVLQADPDIDWVISPYDFATTYIAQAVMEVGMGDRVSTISWGGHPFNMQMIANNQVQRATVAAALEWIGYAAVDQMNRLFNGEPIWTEIDHNDGSAMGSQNYGEQLVDATNLPADLDEFWNSNFDFRAQYRTLWGLE